jgi:hypothetical protein
MQFTVHFSTEEDALHGAALVIRGGQHPWLIEGPGVHLEPQAWIKCSASEA